MMGVATWNHFGVRSPTAQFTCYLKIKPYRTRLASVTNHKDTNLVTYRYAIATNITSLPQIQILTLFLQHLTCPDFCTSTHSQSMQHTKGKENKEAWDQYSIKYLDYNHEGL